MVRIVHAQKVILSALYKVTITCRNKIKNKENIFESML